VVVAPSSRTKESFMEIIGGIASVVGAGILIAAVRRFL
jgi:hypothetical protein